MSGIWQSPSLALPRIRHGFFGRQGGVSEGLYASLNCGYGSGDDIQHVAENRARVAAAFERRAEALCTVYQVHGDAVAEINAPWVWSDAPQADAMVTRRPNILLGILTADCAPVLLADADARVIGAAHAGWKGAKIGILESTVNAMLKLGARAERIHAAIGPCISWDSYAVGPEFVQQFLKQSPEHQRFFKLAGTQPLFDLKGFVRARLQACGVKTIDMAQHDTYSEASLFFSYRRATKRQEAVYGRQASVIMMED